MAVASFAIVGGAAVLLEILVTGFRSWTVEHPATVCLGTGLLLFTSTVYGFERVTSQREAARWLMPGREALNSWVFAVDDAVQSVSKLLAGAARDVGQEAPSVADLLEQLTRSNPGALRDVADEIWREMRQIGLVTNSVAAVSSRSGDLAGATELMFEVQAKLDELAGSARFLAMMLHPIVNGDEAHKVAELVRGTAGKFEEGLQSVGDDIAHVRLWIMETREGQ